MKKVDALYISRTYDGSLEGIPSSQIIIKEAKDYAQKLWGTRATVVCSPEAIEVAYSKEEVFPPWQHLIWISDIDPVKDINADGSELVIIWWDKIFNRDIDYIVSKINWKEQAKDFYY